MTQRARTVTLDPGLSPADLAAVAAGLADVALGPEARVRLAAGRTHLAAAIDGRRRVYGVTTGFGPLADRVWPHERARDLQHGLVNHLATGVGPRFDWRSARAIAAARLSALCQGWSGASEGLIDTLVALLNSPYAPAIPQQGTVGASGDLTPLAHLALALMGRGAFIDIDGQPVTDAVVFAVMARAPIALDDRDGLALVNGTSAMTGLAALSSVEARRLVDWSIALTAAVGEVLEARTEAWRDEFSRARPHPGQADAAAALRARVAGSGRTDARPAAEAVIGEGFTIDPRPLQDAYTLRCAPQVIGAAADALAFHDAVVGRELASATDNPILIGDPPFALHGGNFMGSHVALASDAARLAVGTLAGLAERRLARLCNPATNGGLPMFLHRNEGGVNSGLMGAQVTATALLAELRTLGPASIQSLPTNADNQDVVSMGTVASRHMRTTLEAAFRIFAIEAIAVAEALDLAVARDPTRDVSPAAWALQAVVRAVSAPILVDRPLSREIEDLAMVLAETDPPAARAFETARAAA